MNANNLCAHPDHQDKLCWIAILADPKNELTISRNPIDMQDDITICHECEKFENITKRGFGRRAADEAVITTVMRLIEQLSLKKHNLQQTANQLKQSLEQLSLLKNITDALARSDSLEKSLRIILTGATSGDAFCFNRAAVLLINEKNAMLEGKSAIGPENNEEAIRIWREISKIPLARLLEEIIIENEFVSCSLEIMVSKVKIPQSDSENPLVKVFNEAKERIFYTRDKEFSRFEFTWWPNAEQIVAVPLICEGKPLGLILADNAISKKPINDESVESLKSLANACAPGLQNAILHEKLQAQIKELERVHELFKLNQAYLVRHERLADIGTLATKVAHEFRIPLVTIGGYARRIIKTINSDLFDKHMVEVIIDEVDRLSKITSEILEYSRSSKLSIRECNLNVIVEDTILQLEEKLNSAGIIAEKKFENKTLNVRVDSERFKQVILNLIDNAIDAMGNGGNLTIKTSRHNDYVVLDIKDTGKGIDKYGLENLFNLFYTTKDKGSGLGLPVSKKIVDDHGGYINVNSLPGEGTVFSVCIPDYNQHQETGNVENK